MKLADRIFEARWAGVPARFAAGDDMIVRWLEAEPGREFEPETGAFFLKHLHEREGLVVDVGASTGWFSIPAALHGRHVVAIEPNERVARRLRLNCEISGVSGPRFEIYDLAASDHAGQVVFFHNPAVPLTSGGSVQAPTCARPAREMVPCRRLDDLIGPRKVAVLKVDVEGHELAVLEGARRVIESWTPALILEANTEAHRETLEIWSERMGYVLRSADERNLLGVHLADL